DAEACGVAGRDRERLRRAIRRVDSRARALAGDGEGDRARARAEIRDPALAIGREVCERALDEELRLRPRDQRSGRDLELERPELAPPGEVGDRLAPGAARD